MATPKNNSVMKAFDILQLLAKDSRPLSPQQIAKETGASLSTTHRFLLTLEEIGAVARRSAGHYHLGMLISELGQSAGREQILTERAKIHIEALAENLGETVCLTLFNTNKIQKVAWHEPTRPLVCRESSDFGRCFHNTAVGKLYLYKLPPTTREESLTGLQMDPMTPHSVRSLRQLRRQIQEIGEAGIAVNKEETELGLIEICAPIQSSQGEIIGALTISAPLSRMQGEQFDVAIVALRQSIQAITSRAFFSSYTVPGKAKPKGSFPHVKRVENTVFISGTSSRRPDESFSGVTIFPDGSIFHDTYEQTRETMINIKDILGTLSLKTSDIVNLEAFLIVSDDRKQFQSALQKVFGEYMPAVTITVAKALPHPHQAVMIKAIASCYNV